MHDRLCRLKKVECKYIHLVFVSHVNGSMLYTKTVYIEGKQDKHKIVEFSNHNKKKPFYKEYLEEDNSITALKIITNYISNTYKDIKRGYIPYFLIVTTVTVTNDLINKRPRSVSVY